MTLSRNNLLALTATVVAFLAALALFWGLNRGTSVSTGESSQPRDVGSLVLLGNSYLQKVRDTGDAAYYTRAEGIFERARSIDPRYSAVYTGLGTLALSRHDFRGGLAYGLKARALAPDVVRPLGVIVDAQVELGRYDDAARTLQRMVDLKPNLASYARVSYFRELHGDLDGALSAMRLAVSAGGAAPENVAYVQSLLGTLQFTRGNLVAAGAAYDEALASFPGYPPARAGVARIDAAQGHLARAISGYRAVVDRLPLPEYAIALGEAEEAAGQRAAARRDYQLVDVEQKLLAQAGVNTDTELAVFDADHGDPAQAVVLARRAWANAPSVRSADALGWSLTRAGRPTEGLVWARRALKLGS